MKCIHCGKALAEGDLFCPKCGKAQKDAAAGSFGFMPAMDLHEESVRSESAVQPAFREAPILREPVYEPVKPVVPVIPPRKRINWKTIACVAAVLAVIIGGIYGISEGDWFSGSNSGSGSGSSRRKKDRDDRDHPDYQSDYDYDDDYGYGDYGYDDYYGYDDSDSGDYDPQPSYYDCPGCTNGRHNLCGGTGIYSNYGYSVECTCDDGVCNQCGGEGILYYGN